MLILGFFILNSLVQGSLQASQIIDPLSPSELQTLVIKDKYTALDGFSYYPVSGDSPPRQHPSVWKALRILKGSKRTVDDFPNLVDISSTSFSCADVNQAGFYADQDTDCQVIRRCDPNGALSSYLCPIETIFNQITLVCDWWYNVDCTRSKRFRDYSNPRLYHPDWPLLDDDQGYSDYTTSPGYTDKSETTTLEYQENGTTPADVGESTISQEPANTEETKATTQVSTSELTSPPIGESTATEEKETREPIFSTTSQLINTEEVTTAEMTTKLTTRRKKRRPKSTTVATSKVTVTTEESIVKSSTIKEQESTATVRTAMPTIKPLVCNLLCTSGDRCVVRHRRVFCARIDKHGLCPTEVDPSNGNTCLDDADCEFDLKCCPTTNGQRTCSERD